MVLGRQSSARQLGGQRRKGDGGTMLKEIDVGVGERIDKACERLAREAPACMVFNDVRVEAAVGDSAGDLQGRWQTGMDRAREEDQRKRAAYEQTDAGKAELAKAAAKSAEERSVHEESLRTIEASGMREKYPWDETMGEISGFGGGYEAACRDMIYAGLVWLDAHPGADLTESEDAKALDKIVCAACPDCSGAMHQATMSALIFIAKQGWPRYVAAMTKRTSERVGAG